MSAAVMIQSWTTVRLLCKRVKVIIKGQITFRSVKGMLIFFILCKLFKHVFMPKSTAIPKSDIFYKYKNLILCLFLIFV